MNDEIWKEEYKKWKLLKPFQIQLLDNGAKSLSQTWLINAMWCDWKDIKRLKQAETSCVQDWIKDPWEDEIKT